MKEIPLTRGKVALVDDQDFDWLNTRKWHATKERTNGVCYAATRNPSTGGISLMHRMILKANPQQRIDHRNRNGLDNQRHNLRFGSQAQNCANARVPSQNTSGFKGVRWHKGAKKWIAYCAGKYIGLFAELQDAVNAYDQTLISKYGEFALTNKALNE